tara:strand:- start:334 stop:1332 length:999 start_codon:yes stop_codon:yes gene_type:complete
MLIGINNFTERKIMNKDDIRLNKAKRDAIKSAWRNITLKTPTQKDDALLNVVSNFKELEQSVWDNVINPVVTKNFPQDDMKILKKYSRGGGYSSGFAQYDNCFYFKPSFSDDSQKQFCWNYNRDDMTALYYNDLMSKGVNPNLYYEYEGKDNNPHFYKQEQDLKNAVDDLKVAKYTGRQDYSSYHDGDINESDISNLDGHYLLVPSGSCHSRVMMIDNQSDWEQLRAFNKTKTLMRNAQHDIFKEKIQLVNDMNGVVDQAKFLSEVKKFWTDLEQCVNFDADEIGTAVSIISDDTKQRLLASAKLRQTQRDMVAVITTPKEVYLKGKLSELV